MRNTFILALLLMGMTLTFSCNNQQAGASTASASSEDAAGKVAGQAFIEEDESAKNILQVAMGSSAHTTLVAGIKAANLENVLANNGPLTVFAPTNAAFEKLPEGTLDNLLKPENQATLANIITYHAAPGNYTEDMLKDGMKLFQATGDYVDITKKDGATYVNGIKIEGSVKASNGIIHIVETVMLPPEK